MLDYYLETCDIRVASPVPKPVKTNHPSKLGNISKLCHFNRVRGHCQVFRDSGQKKLLENRN